MEAEGRYSVEYVGLDCEMTGNAGPETHQLIQIGLACRTETFKSDVGYKFDQYVFQPEALAVCRFTPERIESGPPASQVDDLAREWLDVHFPHVAPRPIGFGVSYFDLPYVHRYLPRTWARLNRQAMDLTTICQYLEDVSTKRGVPTFGFRHWMRGVKMQAEEALGEPKWHDAGYDAQAAVVGYAWLTERVVDCFQNRT